MTLIPLLLIFVIPFIFAVLLLAFHKRWNQKWVLLFSCVVLGMMIVGLVVVFFDLIPAHYCVSWQPNAGEMCIGFGKSALIIVLIMSASLLALLLVAERKNQQYSVYQTAFALLSLVMANVAFLTEHFLMRYAALELVGLCVVIGGWLLAESKEKIWQALKTIFINFRIGDVGLLIAIFVMYAHSGTLNIDQNFTDIILAESNVQSAAAFFLTLTVWVKMAVFPFDRWKDACSEFPTLLRTWFTKIIMPALGAYLLYRIIPILQANPTAAAWIVGVSCGFFLIKKALFSHEDRAAALEQEMDLFSSLNLLLLAACVEQKQGWSFLVLWLIIRAINTLIKTRRAAHSPGSRYSSSWVAHLPYFLTLAFSLITLWHVSQLANPLPKPFLFLSFFFFLLQFIQLQKRIKQHNEVLKQNRNIYKDNLTMNLVNITMTIVLLAMLNVLLFHVTKLVKGDGFWAVSIPGAVKDGPYLILHLVLAFIASQIFLKFNQKTCKWREKAGSSIQGVFQDQRIKVWKDSSPQADVLDVSSAFSSINGKIAHFVYDTFERDLFENLVKTANKFVEFLFRTVEKYTSTDFWNRSLQSIMRISRNMQRMNPGFMRLNLFWFFVFVVILIVIVIGLNSGALNLIG